MYGVTNDGFVKKTKEEISESLENRAKTLFGNDVDLSESSPIKMLIELIAWELSQEWDGIQDAYSAHYLKQAVGKSLDDIVSILIKRKDKTKAVVDVEIQATQQVLLVAGQFIISTASGIEYEIVSDTIINTGSNIVNFQAVEGGTDGNVESGLINQIVTPEIGITAVENITDATGGSNEETDYELKKRFYKSLLIAGGSTVDAIRAKILENSDAIQVKILENDKDIIDNGMPPHSVECLVIGGTDVDIAKAILESKPAGTETYGDITVNVEDKSGTIRDISFRRAESENFKIYINITKNDNFPNDGIEKIKNEIVDYIGGEKTTGEIVKNDNLGGEIVYNKLYDQIFNVPGVVDVKYLRLYYFRDKVYNSTDGVREYKLDEKISTDYVNETVVKSEDGQTEYTEGVDYTITEVVGLYGEINTLPSGSIAENVNLKISYIGYTDTPEGENNLEINDRRISNINANNIEVQIV